MTRKAHAISRKIEAATWMLSAVEFNHLAAMGYARKALMSGHSENRIITCYFLAAEKMAGIARDMGTKFNPSSTIKEAYRLLNSDGLNDEVRWENGREKFAENSKKIAQEKVLRKEEKLAERTAAEKRELEAQIKSDFEQEVFVNRIDELPVAARSEVVANPSAIHKFFDLNGQVKSFQADVKKPKSDQQKLGEFFAKFLRSGLSENSVQKAYFGGVEIAKKKADQNRMNFSQDLAIAEAEKILGFELILKAEMNGQNRFGNQQQNSLVLTA